MHTLSNGLQVALIPDHRVPLVHLQAAVRAGLPSETPETNGLNQLLASTLPKGTATRSAQEIAVTLESLGASVSAGTGNNALLVQAGGLAPDIETIAAVFSEILVAPSLPDDAITREKASQLAALEEAGAQPEQSVMIGDTVFDIEMAGADRAKAEAALKSLSGNFAQWLNDEVVNFYAQRLTQKNRGLVFDDFDDGDDARDYCTSLHVKRRGTREKAPSFESAKR